jgi:hypothetical protein
MENKNVPMQKPKTEKSVIPLAGSTYRPKDTMQ